MRASVRAQPKNKSDLGRRHRPVRAAPVVTAVLLLSSALLLLRRWRRHRAKPAERRDANRRDDAKRHALEWINDNIDAIEQL